MEFNANAFVSMVEKHEMEVKLERRAIATERVKTFLENWYNEVKENRMLDARVALSIKEAREVFYDLEVAREILVGLGFVFQFHPEERKGWLWWKEVTPAYIAIFPRKARVGK